MEYSLKAETPEIGRLLKSKDHEYPFYFDGKHFVSIDDIVRLDSIRSDGDYYIFPTYRSVALSALREERNALVEKNESNLAIFHDTEIKLQDELNIEKVANGNLKRLLSLSTQEKVALVEERDKLKEALDSALDRVQAWNDENEYWIDKDFIDQSRALLKGKEL
jgi:hypothetical protein